jgi:hypothetical protein
MALQGNLRDFSASEILQLIGTQKKSGCLFLEWNTERAVVYIHDGRIVSTRPPGMVKDDPLLAFLRATRRLSDEQYRGLLTIQKESGRDLEDLLLNGRYLDSQELAMYLERQILDDLMRVVRWESGSYRFDPNDKWPNSPLVLLSMEGAMIEAARRGDEQKRFVSVFKDPYQVLGVRDLPDPDEPLSEEERELFGIIDGQHTVAEVVDAAPLSEYEAYEALFRMLEAQWIEVVGRRDPGTPPAAAPSLPARSATTAGGIRWVREAAVAAAFLAALAVLRGASSQLHATAQPDPSRDVYAAAQVRDLRYALDLFARERGRYPAQLAELVADDWIAADHVRVPGYTLRYRPLADGRDYQLRLEPARGTAVSR